MRVVSSVAAIVAAAFLVAAVAEAGTLSWATKANRVCNAWTAKAKKVLGNRQIKTAAQAYSFSVKATSLEKQQLSALEKIENPTASGKKALQAAQADIAEIETAINDWKAGNRSAFTKAFVKWSNDRRANKAFIAAGAKDCG